jgi:hypothetical protein
LVGEEVPAAAALVAAMDWPRPTGGIQTAAAERIHGPTEDHSLGQIREIIEWVGRERVESDVGFRDALEKDGKNLGRFKILFANGVDPNPLRSTWRFRISEG